MQARPKTSWPGSSVPEPIKDAREEEDDVDDKDGAEELTNVGHPSIAIKIEDPEV